MSSGPDRGRLYRGFRLAADLGPGVGHAEAVAYGPRELREGSGGQSAPAVPLLRRRGQAGQVLGPRVQQGEGGLENGEGAGWVSVVIRVQQGEGGLGNGEGVGGGRGGDVPVCVGRHRGFI